MFNLFKRFLGKDTPSPEAAPAPVADAVSAVAPASEDPSEGTVPASAPTTTLEPAPAAPQAPITQDQEASAPLEESVQASGSESAQSPGTGTVPGLAASVLAAQTPRPFSAATGPARPAHLPVLAGASPAKATPEPEPEERTGWMSRLRQGLSRTGQSLNALFVAADLDDALYDDLEAALIMADAGMPATEALLTRLRERVRREAITETAQVKEALREILTDHLSVLERRPGDIEALPLVVMLVGVNGAGKTTSIGKLARAFQGAGARVLLAAGDTFRAAAREQLAVWGERNGVTVIAQEGADPAAVAFDAVQAGRARGMSVVMVDTAGRLPTQSHLMEELRKIRRVINKADATAPHEVLLVVDGNTGQNALAQIKAFDEALGLTGLIVTKLDGTPKGGILAAVAAGTQGVRPVPVAYIGVGEGIEDLQPFRASEFAHALID